MALYIHIRPDVSLNEQIQSMKQQVETYLNSGDFGSGSGGSGTPGPPGAPGAPGHSSYLFYRYSANADGSQMTVDPQSSTAYMGVYVTDTNQASTDPTDYTWFRIKGEDAEDMDYLTNLEIDALLEGADQ